MRLISQFGEIEYFKSLKYDALSAPNAALVIFREEKAARECMKRSPVRFRMGRASAQRRTEVVEDIEAETADDTPARNTESRQRASRVSVYAPFGLNSNQSRALSTSALPDPPANRIRMPFDPPPPADPPRPAEEDSRLFQIISNPSKRQFRDHINAGHYYGSFAIDSKMPGQEDLAKKVPFMGLSCVDWKAAERPWRAMAVETRRHGGQGRLGKLMRQRPDSAVSESMDIDEHGAGTPPAALKVDESFFKPFDVPAGQSSGEESRASEDDTLDAIMKGWGNMFPGGSAGSKPTQRYSGKPK